jgi:hypothetical protein
MIFKRKRLKMVLPFVVVTIAVFVSVTGTQAAPVKEIVSSYFGREVNLTEVIAHGGPEVEDVCTVESKDICQSGKESAIPGGFQYTESVTVAPNGNVYVADRGNRRIQEFTAAGEFVLMFGQEVNETTRGNLCTEEEIKDLGVKCKTGIEGTAPGQFGSPQSLVVDPTSGDVYVAEHVFSRNGGDLIVGWRVQEFTSGGQWLLEIGKEVNTKTKGNLCTEEEIKECTGPSPTEGNPGRGAFEFIQGEGDLLAVGGPEDLVYVGDKGRVQEFEADGKYKGEITLTSISPAPDSYVTALAVDSDGDIYLVYRAESVENSLLHVFKANGEQVREFVVPPEEPEGRVKINGIALDSLNRLAVAAFEIGKEDKAFGSLYQATTGHLITRFTDRGSSGIAFDNGGKLYSAGENEITVYKPVPVAELSTRLATCTSGAVQETDVTENCTLNGEANPWGVKETEVRFEWGRNESLGEITLLEPVANEKPHEGEEEVPVPACREHEGAHGTRREAKCPEAEITGLRPNQRVYDRLAGYDHNVKVPELLTSETASFRTPIVSPIIVGEPKVSFVRSSSAVLFGELNPENAETRYGFQYAQVTSCEEREHELRRVVPVAECPGMRETGVFESDLYGRIGATLEASGLQPATTYRYVLVAEDEDQAKTKRLYATGLIGKFTTTVAPVPEAETGPYSGLTATSALVAGSVNPDGSPAVYAFEVSLANGAATQYGVVLSGPAGGGTIPVAESLALAGLQPGTTYAYRIKIESGYGTATGEPVLFTTAGLPSALVTPSVLAQLPIPNIAFPKEPKVTPKKLTNAQKLTNALKACVKKRKRRRAACRRAARKKYTTRHKKKK